MRSITLQASPRREWRGEWRAWGVHVTLPRAPTVPGGALCFLLRPSQRGPAKKLRAVDAMAARISTGELGRRPGQGRVDLLLVGDATRYILAGSMQKFLTSTEQITLTISNVKKVAALLAANSFDIIFLKVTSTLTAEEQEAAKLIRSGKKKNTHLLFAFVVPETLRGYISEFGADISFNEPLTLEKVNTVVTYWKKYFTNPDMANTELPPECRLYFQTSCGELRGHFSTDLFLCSELLKNDTGRGLPAPLSSLDKTKKASLLHSSKEKLRRERIKFCCEQLRTLLPYVKGRKSDVASVIEATVDYVKQVRDSLPPVIMAQITECLQSNKRFSKRQMPIELFLPFTATSQREDAMLTSTFSPVQEIQLLTDQGLNVYSMSAAGGPLEEAVRGQPGSVSKSSIEDLYETRVPSTALSLNSFRAVRYSSGPVSSHEAAARANQNISIYLPPTAPSVSNFIPQHCNSMLCPTCPTNPNCLCTPGRELPASSRAASSSIFRGFQESDSDHQASQQSAGPSPQPRDSSYF
ncbi:spermatogenesis- and oogenesis-specific basic helix-loop-helix-containing protein 2-like [Mastomys coucha]|uniref:spermatogenesis- and oogenesis-specific basic helix-loop-helix-containing protein 2-like n=1 Tax=Mastomys coucha TaxID=35658 RepID=UPI00126288CB|nr:spermatogenesis- and oogenesis-specific basic helix-loop-helix-containing protein 2-like [Mastomys coucha]